MNLEIRIVGTVLVIMYTSFLLLSQSIAGWLAGWLAETHGWLAQLLWMDSLLEHLISTRYDGKVDNF